MLAGLLVVVAGELLFSRMAHRNETELLAVLNSGNAAAQIEALHILSNRGDGEVVDEALAARVLQSESGVLREYAMTSNLTKLVGRRLQRASLERLEDPDEAFRRWLFSSRGVGKRPTLSLAEITKYYETLGAE